MNPVKNTIISVETSSDVGSMAIHERGQLVGVIEQHIRSFHDQMLPTMLKSLLSICGMTLDEIAAVAIGKGPGSYTGMRIGSSFVKGLCYSKKIPLIAVNTLKTLLERRWDYPKNEHLWCGLIDARRGRAYALLQDDQGNSLLPDSIVEVKKATFQDWLQKQPITFIGNGADCYADALEDDHSDIIKGHYPKAGSMGRLAYKAFVAEEWQELASFNPLYIGAGVHT